MVYYVRRFDQYVLCRCTFLFALCVQYNVRTYRPVHVFENLSLGLFWISSQVVNVVVVGPVHLFPFPSFSSGCVFSTCLLRIVVALCFRGLSPCALICNLWTQVSLSVQTAWSTNICMLLKLVVCSINYRLFFQGRGCWLCV